MRQAVVAGWPDGDPDVLLEGFGIEESHSVASKLQWGPDGWLYASQWSTVTGQIKHYGTKDKPIHSMGQLIWRYHPERRQYEIFAEGGGNTFGVEIDAKGRVYSGHNGGDTRGFHYVQGGAYRKGFEKHGVLANPYSFGFFEAMKANKSQRFSHTWVLNESPGLPTQYQGKMFAVEPLQGRVQLAEVKPDRSSFETKDLGGVVTSSDTWFRPVDIKPAPDGSPYKDEAGLIASGDLGVYRERVGWGDATPELPTQEQLGLLLQHMRARLPAALELDPTIWPAALMLLG